MTDKEKIKTFIIWRDLEVKANHYQLNENGYAMLMHLNEVCKGWEGKDILALVDKLEEK